MALWLRLRIAGVVAGIAFLSAAPYMYYATAVAFAGVIRARFPSLDTAEVLRLDMVSIAVAVVLASLAGSLFSERYQLGGLGSLDDTKRALPVFLGLGPPVMIGSYLIFGRPLAQAVPGYYPTSLLWAALLMFRGAVFDEVIARYGMMTIFRGVVPRTWIANVLQAVFFTAVGYKSMTFFGLEGGLTAAFVFGIAASFAVHLVQGVLYARFGLIASCAFHLVLETKLLLHALLVG